MRMLCFLITFPLAASVFAQDQMELLAKADSLKQEYVSATFKGTRIINFHSVEIPGRHVLEFMIQHRFGDINGGAGTFFGMDNGATIRFGLGYAVNDRLEIGIGRTNFEKLVDGYLKYRLVRQATEGAPISITLVGTTYVTALSDPDATANGFDKYGMFHDRMSFSFQPIFARKFSSVFSLQISPTYIHYNLPLEATDKNDVFALGLAGRYKFSKRMAVTFEYGIRQSNYTLEKYHNSLGIGWEIETGGHVFQMFFTNSTGIVDPQFITHTSTSWSDGGVRLGFNISRAFNF